MVFTGLLQPEQAAQHLGKFLTLLEDAGYKGSCIGFLPPLPPLAPQAAVDYLQSVIEVRAAGTCILLVASEHNQILATIHLVLETRTNGTHRAEPCKLIVHRRGRRHGFALALDRKLSLIFLDTQEDSAGQSSSSLCALLSWVIAVIAPSMPATTTDRLTAQQSFAIN